MEMCYDGALVMPSSYVTMNEEEMTYVEGGWRFPICIISGIIDVAIAATGFGGITAFGRLTGMGLERLIKKVWTTCGKKICGMLSTTISAIIGSAISNCGIVANAFVSATSLSGLIGLVIDATDKKIDGWLRY